MQFTPYLSFNGDCADAFRFYEKCFRVEPSLMFTFGASPMAEDFAAMHDKIMHATLKVGDQVLNGSDSIPYEKPQGITVAVSLTDIAEAERIFQELSDGGNVQMPLQETFWALRFGQFTDRYGIPWMINCEKPA